MYAPQDLPAQKTSSVDGYALRRKQSPFHCSSYVADGLFNFLDTDQPGTYKVITSETHSISDVLPEGTVYRINTGGPLPAGTDAVIMVECTRLVSSVKDDNGDDIEEHEVEILESASLDENVRQPGSDVKQGELVLQKGEILRSAGGELGTLAFIGRKEVRCIILNGE